MVAADNKVEEQKKQGQWKCDVISAKRSKSSSSSTLPVPALVVAPCSFDLALIITPNVFNLIPSNIFNLDLPCPSSLKAMPTQPQNLQFWPPREDRTQGNITNRRTEREKGKEDRYKRKTNTQKVNESRERHGRRKKPEKKIKNREIKRTHENTK
ncbi:hypothetical protein NC653_001805 [Populus alba x Populus x berolinensis]|uniref:Uncharacterized protein n=2 Tax=Populus alba x Populus x berolinensis TaxID=444605 RepID=A0AAD6WIC3_9ROSI|nr:hypothetical protein NC653_001805 [Populus alba x Populus x berolinensis]